jgi:hypothetical protein
LSVNNKGLKDLVQPRELSLNGTKVTDAGIKESKGLANLRRLELRSPAITDVGFKELKYLKNFQWSLPWGPK